MNTPTRFLVILTSGLLFLSCNKWNLPASPNTVVVLNNDTQNPNNGSITGSVTTNILNSSDSIFVVITSKDSTFIIPVANENPVRFRIENIPPGTTSLIFIEKNDYFFSERVPNIEVTSGRNTDIGNVIINRDEFVNAITSFHIVGAKALPTSVQELNNIVGYNNLNDFGRMIGTNLTLDMGLNEEIEDIPGNDFVIHAKDFGPVASPARPITVSNDGINFYNVGELTIDSLRDYGFDIHETSLSKARYVCIDDSAGTYLDIYYVKALDINR